MQVKTGQQRHHGSELARLPVGVVATLVLAFGGCGELPSVEKNAGLPETASVQDAAGSAALATGSAGGPCYANQTCNDSLQCKDGKCGAATPGVLGGPCFPNGSCFEPLVCVAGSCAKAPSGKDADEAAGQPDVALDVPEKGDVPAAEGESGGDAPSEILDAEPGPDAAGQDAKEVAGCTENGDCKADQVCVNGNCVKNPDENSFDPGANGVEGLGGPGSRLPFGTETGSFLGVSSYSNYMPCKATPDCWYSTVADGVKKGSNEFGYTWQCVEYVIRFFVKVHGYPSLKGSGHAVYYWKGPNTAAAQKLEKHENGGTVPPAPKDMIIFDAGNDVGHIAIVRSVKPSEVCIIQQNWSHNSAEGNMCLKLIIAGDKYTVADLSGKYKTMGWRRPPGSTPGCVVDTQCPIGHVCTPDQTCAPKNDCAACPVGTTCDASGKCLKDCEKNACQDKGQASGYLCDGQKLVGCGSSGACKTVTSEKTCATGSTCDAAKGMCSDPCAGVKCGECQSCNGGVCAADATKNNAGCGTTSGYQCDAGKCSLTKAGACQGKECGTVSGFSCGECKAGWKCDASYACIPDCGNACAGIACGSAPNGCVCGSCGQNQECKAGACVGTANLCAPCSSGNDCMSGGCDTYAAPYDAVPKFCFPNKSCGAPAECPQGWTCMNGQCWTMQSTVCADASTAAFKDNCGNLFGKKACAAGQQCSGAGECKGVCGNGTCDAGESPSNCPSDCKVSCSDYCGKQAPTGCWCDSECKKNGDCCAEGGGKASSCAGSTCSACNTACSSSFCQTNGYFTGTGCSDGNTLTTCGESGGCAVVVSQKTCSAGCANGACKAACSSNFCQASGYTSGTYCSDNNTVTTCGQSAGCAVVVSQKTCAAGCANGACQSSGPTATTASCTSYKRGASATCTLKGSGFVSSGTSFIGCFQITSTSVTSTAVTISGAWICNCSLGPQEAAYKNPDGAKASWTGLGPTTAGKTVVSNWNPQSAKFGSTQSFAFTGCNLGAAVFVGGVSVSNVSVDGSATQVTFTGKVVGGAGSYDVAVKKFSGASGDDAWTCSGCFKSTN